MTYDVILSDRTLLLDTRGGEGQLHELIDAVRSNGYGFVTPKEDIKVPLYNGVIYDATSIFHDICDLYWIRHGELYANPIQKKKQSDWRHQKKEKRRERERGILLIPTHRPFRQKNNDTVHASSTM